MSKDQRITFVLRYDKAGNLDCDVLFCPRLAVSEQKLSEMSARTRILQGAAAEVAKFVLEGLQNAEKEKEVK